MNKIDNPEGDTVYSREAAQSDGMVAARIESIFGGLIRTIIDRFKSKRQRYCSSPVDGD